MELAYAATQSSSPACSSFQKITVKETESVPKEVNHRRRASPDYLVADLWESNSWYPTEWPMPWQFTIFVRNCDVYYYGTIYKYH